MVDTSKINEITRQITSKFNPDKIILFGSYASGNQNDDSDIDLLIIQDTDLLPQNRGFEIRMALLGLGVPLDIFVYTHAEFDNELLNKQSFLNSALKNAKVLYERAD